ncbi:MAG TPA: NAD(P)/FAD-dependent oxidoreductase [Gemmatimonadales bacterium]|nr:NAD(P)/FAD-dependent oxidoreductase [Gemmatimonadales bacterium]
MNGCKVAIVGGGILGLELAARLSADGCAVTVFEGASQSGGLAAPAPIGTYTWDRFYHVILGSDSYLQAFLNDLGLSHQLRWGTTRTGFYVDGRLYSMSSTLEFLRFPPLSLVDKARLAATIWHASGIKNWKPLESLLATEWLRTWSGQRTVDRIWLPLLRAKLGDNYRRASAAFIGAIITRMYAARRSGMKREVFGYVEGGYATVLRACEDRLRRLGVELRAGRAVTGIRSRPDGVTLDFAGGPSEEVDRVVLTIPCSRIADLCPQLTAAEQTRLRRVTYQGIICASFLCRQPLAGYYVTNITDSWVPFTAVIETTSLVDRATFGGNNLVYLPRYVTQDDPFWNKSDAEIQREFLAALQRMYPRFSSTDVIAFQIARVREMLAVSTLGYSDEVLPPVRTSLDNVFIVNSAQIAHGTLNVNETLALAVTKSAELSPYLRPALPRVSAAGVAC